MKYKEEREQPDAYLDWAEFLQKKDPARVLKRDAWEAVLVQPLIDDIFEKLEDDRDLLVDEAERDYALQVRERTGDLAPFFLYRRLGLAGYDDVFTVLLRGVPTDQRKGREPDKQGQGADKTELRKEGQSKDEPPLLAVIDDGLGFLNERYQRVEPGGMVTRIEGVFIQSLMQNPPGPGGMAYGMELSGPDVQALIQRPDERAVYKEINNTVFLPDTVRTTENADSHGSHIIDLAGGADPADTSDPMRMIPMVMVQLPPQIVDDTSGLEMVPHILQGLHWILLKAILLGKSRVVVNLSFGITAGPKDGTSLFATHTAFLIQLADILGIELHVVVPFGNDYQNRQVAAVEMPSDDKETIDLRLQSDDRAPSYVEIRPESNTALADIALGLIAPDGTQIGPVALAPGNADDIIYRGRIVGRITHVPAILGRAAYLLMAFAPTAPLRDDNIPVNGQGPLIEAGRWTIVMVDETGNGADMRLEIQRGDTMLGYRERGRQAYFDDPDGYNYDMGVPDPTGNVVQGKSYTKLGPGAKVTPDGTNSAFTVVGGVKDRFHTVGGAFLRRDDPTISPGNQDPAVAAQYTALNTRPGRGEPTGGARSEHNRAVIGLRAAGVLSGSTARYAGSSAAAAVYSRNLLLQTGPAVDAIAPDRLPESIHPGAAPRD